ncbi:hypothetical protein [Micromonospora sp. DT233]|uniref:hypothetical protein n=1 Tax=Micromonospora sp. DT233 TaxID=3393432 RepID=UPI003CF9CCD5
MLRTIGPWIGLYSLPPICQKYKKAAPATMASRTGRAQVGSPSGPVHSLLMLLFCCPGGISPFSRSSVFGDFCMALITV